MNIFHPHIDAIRDFVQSSRANGAVREFQAASVNWPLAGPRDIVLQPDLALELGHPEDASLCFTVWTEDSTLVHDNTITLIGPDIHEAAAAGRLPFGKITLVQMENRDEEAAYEIYRNIELTRFDLSLKGYMLRATSQYMREWSRISREAVSDGFSFRILGSALIEAIKALDGVTAAEMVFITRSNEDVMTLTQTGTNAVRLIQAMNKMMTEMQADCASCDYQDVCNDASEMKALRKKMADRKAGGNGSRD